MRYGPALTAAALLLIGLAAGATAGVGALPRTLVTAPHVGWVAQDASLVAWSAEAEGCDRVTALDRRTGRRPTLGLVLGSDDETCSTVGFTIGVGGRRVAWSAVANCCNNDFGSVVTTTVGGTSTRFDGTSTDRDTGTFVTTIAGDGGTLVYARVTLELVGPDCSFRDEPSCEYRFVAGEVRRVVGRKSSEIPGPGVPALVAVSSRRLLVVPADVDVCDMPPSALDPRGIEIGCRPTAAPNGPIHVLEVATGKQLTSFAPRGKVVAAGLSPTLAAVLVEQSGSRRVELFDPATGRFLRSASVPRAAREVAIAGDRVVYSTTRGVHLLRTRDQGNQLVARAAGSVFALSLEGNRVVWAEDGKRVDRIRELRLPAS
jgi:hypothetical protein